MRPCAHRKADRACLPPICACLPGRGPLRATAAIVYHHPRLAFLSKIEVVAPLPATTCWTQSEFGIVLACVHPAGSLSII